MEKEEEIDVVSCGDATGEQKIDTPFQCDECDFVGKSERGLNTHQRSKHTKAEELGKRARKPTRKALEAEEQEHKNVEDPVQRVTTKQLLGGRKRPKTVVENSEDTELMFSETSAESDHNHDLAHVDEEMTVGEYFAKRSNEGYADDSLIDIDAGSMIVGEEIEIAGEEEVGHEEVANNMFVVPIGPAPRRKYTAALKLPTRLIEGDVNGKYKCYMEDCEWRGNYRSLRMDHMRSVHPEWKMPSRFLLQRISKNGVYMNPDEYVPPFPCLVEGCEWRGNFRASRSAHMRKMHPKEHAEKKKKAPGYNSNGSYMCHYPMCAWRGWSRSTRSAHLRKSHPEWRPEESRNQLFETVLTCFHCKHVFTSYPLLVNHIDDHGGIGLNVHEEFDTSEAFTTWLHKIQQEYTMNFERVESNSGPNDIHYILHCSCVGARGVQLATDARTYIYQKFNFLKRRPQQFLTRNKADCSAYLEVREDTTYDRITVKGCLEHTGHRFGTPLVRMTSIDRQLYTTVMEWRHEKDFQFGPLEILDKLNTLEGFTMENFGPPSTLELIPTLAADPIESLRQLIRESDDFCFFGVELGEQYSSDISFGYMPPAMCNLYAKFGPASLCVIDMGVAEFDTLDLTCYNVIVFDDRCVPKCVAVYISSSPDPKVQCIMEKLKSLSDQPPREFICDASQIWVDIAEKLWPQEAVVLISEWSLLEYWSAKISTFVTNEFDGFAIVVALRRFLKCTDPNQFLFFAVEIFESLYECGYDGFAEFFDYMLSDVDFFKRWSPLFRNDFIVHPTLSVSCRVLQEFYLSNDGIERPDQWFAHVTKRMEEFNAVQSTSLYTLRPIEQQRKYAYDPMEFHKQIVQDNAETMLVYEEDGVIQGHVVEEEVIGHEMVTEEVVEEDGVLYHHDMMKAEPQFYQRSQTIAEQSPEHSESTPTSSELIPTSSEAKVFQENAMDSPSKQQAFKNEMVPAKKEEDVLVRERPEDEVEMEVEVVAVDETPEVPSSSAGPSTSSLSAIRRPRILVGNRRPPGRDPVDSPDEQPQRIVKKRDTTKSVVRGRKKKDRFAELREMPPEIMRAIAAHAIAYDGRRKEQRPYLFAPSSAVLAQSATPSVPTPEIRHYPGLPTVRKFTSKNVTAYRLKHPPGSEEYRRQQKIQRDRQRRDIEGIGPICSPRERIPAHRRRPQLPPPPHHSHPPPHTLQEHHDEQQPCTSASLYQ